MEVGRLEAMTTGMAAMEHLGPGVPAARGPGRPGRGRHRAGPHRGVRRPARRGEPDRPDRCRGAAGRTWTTSGRHLVALARVSGFMHGLDPRGVPHRASCPRSRGDGPGARGLAALIAWELLCKGEDRARAVELARFALAGPGAAAARPRPAVGGRRDGARHERPGHAAVLGGGAGAGATAPAACSRRWPCTCGSASCSGSSGDLRAALQSLVTCTEQNLAWSVHGVGQMYVEPFSVHVLLDRGDVAERPRGVRPGPGRRRGSATASGCSSRPRPGCCSRRAGTDAGAGRPGRRRAADAAWWRTRSGGPGAGCARRVLHALGRTDEALALLDEELVLARRWGTPGPGRAGPAGPRRRLRGQRGRGQPADAVDLLARSQHRLDLARARCRRSAHWSRRRPGRGPHPAGAGARAGRDCGADGPAAAGRGPAARAGGRRPGRSRGPRLRLTPAERRIALDGRRGRCPTRRSRRRCS